MPKKPVEENPSKKIKVQIGVVKRMVKEVASYEKEVLTNEARVQKMRDDGRDVYDIRKQEEVLQESYMMVPDSKNRLELAKEELQSLLDQYEAAADLDASSIEEAKALLV